MNGVEAIAALDVLIATADRAQHDHPGFCQELRNAIIRAQSARDTLAAIFDLPLPQTAPPLSLYFCTGSDANGDSRDQFVNAPNAQVALVIWKAYLRADNLPPEGEWQVFKIGAAIGPAGIVQWHQHGGLIAELVSNDVVRVGDHAPERRCA